MLISKKGNQIMYVGITVVVFKEEDIFVAYCPALELSPYGDNEMKAKEAFDEALEILIEETSKKGTLERELLKLGWKLQQRPKPFYQPPMYSLQEVQKISKRNPSELYNQKFSIPVYN